MILANGLLGNLIKVPFGYLLDWLYQFTTNYGLSLILFAIIIKLVLLPASSRWLPTLRRLPQTGHTGNQSSFLLCCPSRAL